MVFPLDFLMHNLLVLWLHLLMVFSLDFLMDSLSVLSSLVFCLDLWMEKLLDFEFVLVMDAQQRFILIFQSYILFSNEFNYNSSKSEKSYTT